MRVLWISHLLPWPPIGGNMQRSYNLLEQACRRHEVHLVALAQTAHRDMQATPERAADPLANLCASVTTFPIPAERTRLHHWLLIGRSYFSELPYDVHWLHSKEMKRTVENLARRHAFDLVHVDTLGVAQYAQAVPNVPFALTHHNVESDMMRQRAEREDSWPRRLYFKREAVKLAAYERRLARKASVHIVVSDLDAQRLRAVVGDVPTVTVENGVDPARFSPRERQPLPGQLIFVGGMNAYANREAVLYFVEKVWPRLPTTPTPFRLTVVGRDPPPELLEAASRSNRISVPGFVEDLEPLIRTAEIYICPIRSGGGTRLKVLDALAMAVPLVSTSFAIEGLGLEPEVHYLPADSAAEFASQILRLRCDASLRHRLARAGRQLVEDRFSWSEIGRQLEKAYSTALYAPS